MFQRLLDAIQALPMRKIIDPDTHAVVDYLTVSAFLATSGLLWDRNRRASAAALLNGLFVLSYSLFTDYSGSLRRSIRFEDHGKLDMAQAALALLCPAIFGFGGDSASLLFRGQAMDESMVLAMTDWYARRQKAPVAGRSVA
jgi:hypothetical protein